MNNKLILGIYKSMADGKNYIYLDNNSYYKDFVIHVTKFFLEKCK
jgi:hypothetical protein